MWERAYAVCETKRSVEGAAGTRVADKTIVEPRPCEMRNRPNRTKNWEKTNNLKKLEKI